MEDGNLRELQARIEMLEARLVEAERHPAARVRALLARLGSSRRVRFALVAAVVATLAEGVAPAGTDNLSVPLLTAATLYLLLAA